MLNTLKLLAMFAGGAVIGAGVAHLGLRLPGVGSGSALVFFIALVSSLWPNIVLHEAGHALAGLARGMRPIAGGIGPLRLERGGSGWRWRWEGGIRGIGGFAALLPDGNRGLGRGDQIVMLAGGPLANLLTAALCLAALTLAALPAWAADILAGTAASALLLGLGNLVPSRSQGWRSDGQGIVDLLRDSPDGALQQQVSQLGALTMAGVRPREWPEAIQPTASAASSSPMLAAVADSLLLSRATDRGDAPGAGQAAARLAARYWEIPEAMRPVVSVSMAGYAAVMAGDAELLGAWRPLCDGKGLMDLTPYRRWLDAELAMMHDEPARVQARVYEAREALPWVPDPVGRLLLGEFLDRLEARLATTRPLPAKEREAVVL